MAAVTPKLKLICTLTLLPFLVLSMTTTTTTTEAKGVRDNGENCTMLGQFQNIFKENYQACDRDKGLFCVQGKCGCRRGKFYNETNGVCAYPTVGDKRPQNYRRGYTENCTVLGQLKNILGTKKFKNICDWKKNLVCSLKGQCVCPLGHHYNYNEERCKFGKAERGQRDHHQNCTWGDQINNIFNGDKDACDLKKKLMCLKGKCVCFYGHNYVGVTIWGIKVGGTCILGTPYLER